MAMDQSALLDLLAQLKLTDVTDRIRSATETLYQELIDAEATAFIGAAPFDRSDRAGSGALNRARTARGRAEPASRPTSSAVGARSSSYG
jgi:transposase-like protein